MESRHSEQEESPSQHTTSLKPSDALPVGCAFAQGSPHIEAWKYIAFKSAGNYIVIGV